MSIPPSTNLATEVHLDQLRGWQAEFNANDELRLAQLLITKTDPLSGILPRAVEAENPFIFNTELKDIRGSIEDGVHPKVTDQKLGKTGQCWAYATTNVARYAIRQRLNLPKDFELSQAYLVYYDQLEKCNAYLENMINLIDEPIDSRDVALLNSMGIMRGGWNISGSRLLEKYGCVPAACFARSAPLSDTKSLYTILNERAKAAVCKMRDYRLKHKAQDIKELEPALRHIKNEAMASVHRIIGICVGIPPAPDADFEWEYLDAEGKGCKIKTTPKKFYHEHKGPMPIEDDIVLINDPRNAYDTVYSFNRDELMCGGKKERDVNVSMDVIEQALIAAIKADRPCYFGMAFNADVLLSKGVLDPRSSDLQAIYQTGPRMTKKESLEMFHCVPGHAAVITGVHVGDGGKPVRYRIENSWGEGHGNKGWYLATAEWMRLFGFQFMVPRQVVPSKIDDLERNAKAVILPLHDALL